MALAGYNCVIQLASLPSTAFTNEATTVSADLKSFTISNAVKSAFDKAVAVVVQKGNNELQTITITGGPTGGTFTLTFGANTTSALAYNATAAQLQTALQALASIGTGNALVTGSAGGPYVVQFAGTLGLTNQAMMTATPSFTGGTSPGVNIVETQAGGAYATITTGFTLYKSLGRVTFTSAQPVGTQVRFASGNYMTLATVGNANMVEFAGKVSLADETTFNSGGVYSYRPTLLTGTLKIGGWWVNIARAGNLQNRDLLLVQFALPSGNQIAAYCYVSDCSLKNDVKNLVGEDLSFQLTDEIAVA